MTTPLPPAPSEPSYFEPTVEQVARERRRRRFLRLYVYLPLAIVTLISVVLVVLLLVGVFSVDGEDTAAFASALADIVVILWTLPLLLLCAIGPLAYVAYVMNRRQRRKEQPQTGPQAEYGRLQVLLWRVDSFMLIVERKTVEMAPKVAAPLIKLNANMTYVETWLQQAANQLKRNGDRYDGEHDNRKQR